MDESTYCAGRAEPCRCCLFVALSRPSRPLRFLPFSGEDRICSRSVNSGRHSLLSNPTRFLHSHTHSFSLSLCVFLCYPSPCHIRSWPQRFLCIYQVNLADSDRTRSSYKPGMFDDWLLSVFRQKMVEVSSRRHKNCYYHQFFVCACMKMNEQFLNLFACNLYVLSNFLKWWGVCECMLPLLYKSIFVWGKIYLQLVNCRRLDGIRISQVTAVSWK